MTSVCDTVSVVKKSKRSVRDTSFAYILTGTENGHLPNPPDKQSKFVSLSLCLSGERVGSVFKRTTNHKNAFFRDFVTYVNPGISGTYCHDQIMRQIDETGGGFLESLPWYPNFREKPWLLGTARAGAFHFISWPFRSMILPLDDGVDPSFLKVNENIMAVTAFNKRKKMFPLYTKDRYEFDSWISRLFGEPGECRGPSGFKKLGTFPKKRR